MGRPVAIGLLLGCACVGACGRGDAPARPAGREGAPLALTRIELWPQAPREFRGPLAAATDSLIGRAVRWECSQSMIYLGAPNPAWPLDRRTARRAKPFRICQVPRSGAWRSLRLGPNDTVRHAMRIEAYGADTIGATRRFNALRATVDRSFGQAVQECAGQQNQEDVERARRVPPPRPGRYRLARWIIPAGSLEIRWTLDSAGARVLAIVRDTALIYPCRAAPT